MFDKQAIPEKELIFTIVVLFYSNQQLFPISLNRFFGSKDFIKEMKIASSVVFSLFMTNVQYSNVQYRPRPLVLV